MRKLFAILLLVLGAGAGLLVTVVGKGAWGEGVVMAGLGLLFAAPFAGVVAAIGRRSGPRRSGSGWIRGSRGISSGGLFKGDVPIRRWDR